MKIVHVVRQYAPSVGGLEDAVANLCRHLCALPDVQVRVVTLDRVFSNRAQKLPAHEIINGIEVTRLGFFGSKRYPLAFSVLSAIKDADIVHVHAIDFFFDFLAWTKFLHGKTLVASTHGGFFHTSFASRLKKIYFQTITRLSCLAYKAICASSDNDARTFAQIAPRKIVTIENGVNIEKWRDAGSRLPVRTMIFIGRWSDNKRVTLLIDLIVAAQKLDPAWKLIIIGVPAHDTQASLSAYAQSKGIADRVAIHEKPDENEIKELIGQASYIASASAYEGFGLTAIEGLSAGLVPVLTPLAPFQKVLDQMGCGIAIDTAHLDRTADEVEKAHKSLIESAGAQREKALKLAQNYAWPDTAKRFLEVYQKALLTHKENK